MNVPEELKYTKEHEWVKIDGEVATVGITDYAQSELGDIVFVELPQAGDLTKQFETCANIEAVKAVSDFYAPLSGEVTEVNTELENTPQLVNQEPYDKGWFIKITLGDKGEIDKLLSADEYKKLIS
ncbi:MAG: glycine cleavage system protein GcvH [bacterium]